MRAFLYRLVERMHGTGGSDRPLSRNKHFHLFEAGGGKALRIDRHLRDLEKRFEEARRRGERPTVRPLPDGSVQLILKQPRLSLVRTATLTREEVALLRRNPAGAWALGEPAPEDASEEVNRPEAAGTKRG